MASKLTKEEKTFIKNELSDMGMGDPNGIPGTKGANQ